MRRRPDVTAQCDRLGEGEGRVPIFIAGFNIEQSGVDEFDAREFAIPLPREQFTNKIQALRRRWTRGLDPAHRDRSFRFDLEGAREGGIGERFDLGQTFEDGEDVEVAGVSLQGGELFEFGGGERFGAESKTRTRRFSVP